MFSKLWHDALSYPFSALTLFVRRQVRTPACKPRSNNSQTFCGPGPTWSNSGKIDRLNSWQCTHQCLSTVHRFYIIISESHCIILLHRQQLPRPQSNTPHPQVTRDFGTRTLWYQDISVPLKWSRSQGPRSHGVNWPPLFQLLGPLDPSLFVGFTCAQSVAVVIHSFITCAP